MQIYRKSRIGAPQGFFECEGRGLQWLAQAQQAGGPRVVKVVDWSENYLNIERVQERQATVDAAYNFGAALAKMHDFGAQYFGQAPDHYHGTCWFGPLQDPVPMDTGSWTDVVTYLVEGRLIPMVKIGISRFELNDYDLQLTQDVAQALPDLLGKAADDKPARVHGDLWAGNVMFTQRQQQQTDADGTKTDSGANLSHQLRDTDIEAVLIDPAAHGGHREEDLAMLHLFGMRHLDAIMEGYQRVHPLKAGFEQRLTIWQLYPIVGHAVFFGGGYVNQYRSMCRSLLR